MDEILKRIEAIKKEIRETPYHKGTEHHIGLLRARLARLRDQIVEKQTKKGGGGGGGLPAGRQGFAIKKHGDATVVLVGFPSVGKSTLLNQFTNAKSPVAPYEFTTLTVIPGMMKYKGAAIQVVDVPGLVEGAAHGRGRGRKVLSVVRGADLLLIMVEVDPGHSERDKGDFGKIERELYANGVRINQDPPNVVIKKTLRGGLKINSSAKQELDRETIKEVAREFGLINAEITLKENLTLERLVDAFAKNRVYIRALYVTNKIDLARGTRLPHEASAKWGDTFLKISAEKGLGLNKLREAIWNALALVRVYLRRPDGTVDRDAPMLIREGQTLRDVAEKVGTEFAEAEKEAKIWGPGARFPGQRVSLATSARDEMEVMFT